jgi:hypothetical protein
MFEVPADVKERLRPEFEEDFREELRKLTPKQRESGYVLHHLELMVYHRLVFKMVKCSPELK